MSGAIHPLIAGAFAAMNESGGRWCLLRASDLRRPRGDVDLLIDPSAARLVDTVLTSRGFVRVRPFGHGTHRFYHAYAPTTDAWVTLDVVTDVAFGRYGEFRTVPAAELLARRDDGGEVPALAAADAFWHLLLHDLLGRGEVAARHRERLRELRVAGSRGSPLAAVVDRIEPGWSAVVVDATDRDDWDAVSRRGEELATRWARAQNIRTKSRAMMRRGARRLPFIRSSAPGVSVAIIGPDGAGKTTLAEALRRSTPIPSGYVYLGIWRQGRLEDRLRRVFGARLAFRLAKLLWKSAAVASLRRLGRLVLLDRYTCDADLPSSDLDWKGRVSAALVRRTCAEPDLLVLLDADVELMYARKGEHGLHELQLRRDAYRAMAKSNPKIVVLDAAQPANHVRRQATAAVWEKFSVRSEDATARNAESFA